MGARAAREIFEKWTIDKIYDESQKSYKRKKEIYKTITNRLCSENKNDSCNSGLENKLDLIKSMIEAVEKEGLIIKNTSPTLSGSSIQAKFTFRNIELEGLFFIKNKSIELTILPNEEDAPTINYALKCDGKGKILEKSFQKTIF